MNDRLIAWHIRTAYRDGYVALEGRADDILVAPNGVIALVLPRSHAAFDSREMFPKLPEDGEQIVRGDGARRPPPSISKMIATLADCTVPAEPTPWLYQAPPGGHCRVFWFQSGKQKVPMYVNTTFTKLLGDDLDAYSFGTCATTQKRGSKDAKYGSGPLVINRRADATLVAVMMPMTMSTSQQMVDLLQGIKLPGELRRMPA